MYFYVNLAKRLIAEHGEVMLSALGLAIATTVSVAEILKKDKLVVEKSKLQHQSVSVIAGRPAALYHQPALSGVAASSR